MKMDRKKILIVDDDVYIGDMLEEILEKEGYQVLRAYSGTEASMILDKEEPHLMLLDLMLPGMKGEDLIEETRDVPVIVVSAKVDIDSKVELLMKGAEDYVTKPFDVKELLARIEVNLRRGAFAGKSSLLEVGDLRLDPGNHQVMVKDREVRLTKTEYAILKQLIINYPRIITKSVMLDLISGDTPDCTDSSLKVHVSNLRRKLAAADGKERIEAVWGIGFKLTRA